MTLVGGSSGSANERGSSEKDKRRRGRGKNMQGERKFARSSWEDELDMIWRNAVSVLDAQPGGGRTLNDCLGGVVYLSSVALQEGKNEGESVVWDRLERTCRMAMDANEGITAGAVDGTRGVGVGGGGGGGVNEDFGRRGEGMAGDLFGGYEDEGMWREVEGDNVMNAVIKTRETSKNSSSPFPPPLPAKEEKRKNVVGPSLQSLYLRCQ